MNTDYQSVLEKLRAAYIAEAASFVGQEAQDVQDPLFSAVHDYLKFCDAVDSQPLEEEKLSCKDYATLLNHVAGLLKLSDHHLTNGPYPIERGETYWRAQAAVVIGECESIAMQSAKELCGIIPPEAT